MESNRIKNIIYFLKEFPDKWILFTLCLLIGGVFLYTRNDFSSQLFNSVVSALIGLLIGRSKSEPSTNINTGKIETPSINNDEMNNATINVSNNDSSEIDK